MAHCRVLVAYPAHRAGGRADRSSDGRDSAGGDFSEWRTLANPSHLVNFLTPVGLFSAAREYRIGRRLSHDGQTESHRVAAHNGYRGYSRSCFSLAHARSSAGTRRANDLIEERGAAPAKQIVDLAHL